jgi:hypothetical protein
MRVDEPMLTVLIGRRTHHELEPDKRFVTVSTQPVETERHRKDASFFERLSNSETVHIKSANVKLPKKPKPREIAGFWF